MLLKSSKAWLRYEKNNILNKLIHKPQAIHRGQRVCEENNELELEEKKRNLGEIFCGERTEFERLQKNSDATDWSDFDYKDSLQHKGNSTVSI